MKISTAIEEFTGYLEGLGRSPYTIRGYQKRLAQWRESPVMSNTIDLEDVSAKMLDQWAASLRGSRVMNPNSNQIEPRIDYYSDHTIAGLIVHLKAFVKFCYMRGLIDRNVAQHLKRPNLSHNGRNKAMSKSDLKKILDVCVEKYVKTGNGRDLAIVAVIADTGIRRGELANLRLSNIDLSGRAGFVDGKTGRRPIEFTARTGNLISEWLRHRARLPHVTEHDHVFVSTSPIDLTTLGRPMTPDSVTQMFRRLAKKAVVKGRCSPHALRHLVGKEWIELVNPELVRQKLGHRSVTTTLESYANQDRAEVRRATIVHSLLHCYVADRES